VNEQETDGSEVSMTGTDGARVLSFPRAAPGVEKEPETAPTSSARTSSEVGQSSSARTSPENGPTSSARTVTRTFPANKVSVGFLGISQGRVWRPKVYVRNPNYPRVTAVGCFFVEHSGGYQLIHTKSNKYLGHYTVAAISELEMKYAKKKRSSRSRKGK
jgi:hypothetical protein